MMGNTYSDTVFCFADTVVLLWKHSDFATKTHPFITLVLSALPIHIQAYQLRAKCLRSRAGVNVARATQLIATRMPCI